MTWLILQVQSMQKMIMNYRNWSDRVQSMTKTRQDNDVTDHTGVEYTKNDIELHNQLDRVWSMTKTSKDNDENQQAFKDPLHVPVKPITKARSKKIKEALNGLIQEIWADSNAEHSKPGPNEDEGVINLIQAIEG